MFIGYPRISMLIVEVKNIYGSQIHEKRQALLLGKTMLS